MLPSDNGIDMVKFFKRMISIVMSFFVAVIKNFVGQCLNSVVDSLISGVVVSAVRVFGFFS